MVEGYRLSPQQTHLWDVQAGRSSYLAHAVVDLRGDLDRAALRSALREAIQRHEALRTRFERPAGLKLPLQVIDASREPDWIEIAADAAGDREIVERCLTEASALDVERGWIRAVLIHAGERRHTLVLLLPALCADAASMRNLVDEVGRIYGHAREELAPADALAQYPSYSEWQHSQVDDEYGRSAREFWTTQGLGEEWARTLPIEEIPRPLDDLATIALRESFASSALSVSTAGDLLERLEAAASGCGSTPEAFLLAAWHVLLRRLDGSSDGVVGTLASGRSFDELRPAIGPFARFVPNACPVDARQSFADVLRQVDAQRTRCEPWHDYFDWQMIHPASPGRIAPHFPFAFSFEELQPGFRAGSVIFTPAECRARVDRFRLHLRCTVYGRKIAAEIEYDPARYAPPTARLIARFYAALLRAFVRDPQIRVDAVSIVAGDDRRQILRAATSRRVSVPRGCVHEHFAAVAAAHPDRIAVTAGGESLTYRVLNRRANQLGYELRRLGITPDTPVALCVTRSVEAIVGLFGVLKSGGAYMPIDPDLPAARIEQLLAGSRAAAIVTETDLRPRVAMFTGPVLCLDPDWPAVSRHPTFDDDVETDLAHLVYVIHTSGSTGTPKAVGVSHHNLMNYTHAVRQVLEGASGDAARDAAPLRFASVSTLSADLGHTCVFPALLSGGHLHLVDYDVATDARRLGAYVADQAIDVLKMVPSHLRALLACEGGERVVPRRALVLGGESLTPDLADRIAAIQPSCALVHHYGPTETTVGVLTHTVGEDSPRHLVSLPVGRPLANCAAYVCDEQGNLVPAGVTGHLFIGGAGVARGYLNDVRRTADRFVPDPFSTNGGRMYATGDRARYLPDHSIEFLGRVDRQVKIRGHRIELAEIEAALRRHAGVRDAVALVHDDDPDNKRLAAYVVGAGADAGDGAPASSAPPVGDTVSAAALRDFLGRELPEHMIPSAFTVLPALPLTANGKIDYAHLRGLAAEASQPKSVEPLANPIASIVSEICAENLSVERVGLHDDYFELGGHSLLAMRLVSRIRQVFGVELPLRAVFETPTVAGLAASIEAAMVDAAGPQPPPIAPVRRDRELPLSFAQQRLWFLDQLDSNNSYNVPWSLRLRGPLRLDVLRQTLTEIVRRHEVLRTTFELRDGRPVQIIRPPMDVDIPLTDLAGKADLDVDLEVAARRLAGEEARRVFDLKAGPIFRAGVLRLSETDHVLLITIHHIASDAWSRDILTREFMTIYAALLAGRAHDLPALDLQYADYAVWQRDWLRDENLSDQLTYWKTQLAGVPVLELPADRPRPPIQTFSGRGEVLTLSTDVYRALRLLGREHGATFYMTLLAAFQTLLHRYAGQDDIVVGSAIAGRNRSEMEALIGFFVNTVALRVSFTDRPSFVDVLRRVREAALGAYTHQDLPFEKLVEELNPQRDMSRAPLLQAMFGLSSAKTPGTSAPGTSATGTSATGTSASTQAGPGAGYGQLGGLAMEYFAAVETAARVDLSLDAVESESHVMLSLRYNSDIFDARTIRRMLEHFKVLLASIVAEPERPVATLPLLLPSERGRLTEATPIRPSNAFTPMPAASLDRSIGHRFREIAAAHPDRIAIKTRHHTWTYRDLDARATALAQALTDACGPDASIVALLFEHDAPMVAAMLGALMAGKCYVPLDPSHPDERLEDIVSDAQPAAIVASRAQSGRASSLAIDDQPVLILEELSAATQAPDLDAVPVERMAYILYTSGTEGRPKGVVQNHRNVLHFIRSYTNNLHIGERDALTLFSSYGADAAVMDIFAAMLTGAALYPIDLRADSFAELKDWLRAERITVFHSTPTVFSYVADGLTRGDGNDVELPDVRLVVLGGEETLQSHFEKYRGAFSNDCVFVNGLGPTESTVTLQYFANRQTDLARSSVPVGYPVDDTEILLLGEDLGSAGVNGEICIRSPHVALGYWRAPDLTKTLFLSDPDDPRQRIYRTGDLGRLLPDGSVLFLGRRDTQVKINGFRVELGDVRAALNEHPDVLDSVVLCRYSGSGKALVAYFIPRQKPGPDAALLRQFVQSKVPTYMTPAAFVSVERFPRTANGKLDRDALLAIKDVASESSRSITARDLVELRLSQIWADLLDLAWVPVNADFFQVGGSSLSAIRLLARIEQQMGVRIPLAQLFQGAHIESLASIVRQGRAPAAESCVVPIQAHGHKTPFFCVHPVGGTVVCYAELARAMGADRPFYAFQHPAFGAGRSSASIEQLAAMYVDAMIEIQPAGPYQIGGWSMGGVVAYEMAQQAAARGLDVSRLVLFDTSAPVAGAASRDRRTAMDDAELLVAFLANLPLSVEELRQVDPDARMEKVLEVARARRAVVPDFTLDEAQRRFEIAKANLAAAHHYTARTYGGSLTLLTVGDESGTTRQPDRGWGALIAGEVDVHPAPGQHHNMMYSPYVLAIAERLRTCLDTPIIRHSETANV